MIRLFFFICLFCLTFSCYSQSATLKTPDSEVADSEATDSNIENNFVTKKNAFFLTAGPMLMVNTDDETKSAPSPIMFSLGFGYDFLQDKNICGQVRGSFFTNYYLWDGENAQPAEIENRTATVISCMIDLLCGHNIYFGNDKLNQITVSGGVGILTRLAFLSSGVNSDSTTDDEVSSINSLFYSNMNFLYPELSITYLRAFPDIFDKKKFGGEFRMYFPLGSAISGDALDSMIFSLSVKIQF